MTYRTGLKNWMKMLKQPNCRVKETMSMLKTLQEKCKGEEGINWENFDLKRYFQQSIRHGWNWTTNKHNDQSDQW